MNKKLKVCMLSLLIIQSIAVLMGWLSVILIWVGIPMLLILSCFFPIVEAIIEHLEALIPLIRFGAITDIVCNLPIVIAMIFPILFVLLQILLCRSMENRIEEKEEHIAKVNNIAICVGVLPLCIFYLCEMLLGN